ncbi:hypothetical protein D6833_06610 [Candidatus Parcubacteria bacterium]|nr:MAG: hypothetical protein D6833_06610 [Candidatus Parcubacteria bacterium]
MILTACSGGMPKLFWDVDEGKDQPAYARGGESGGQAASRAPLTVPPELRAELELPEASTVGVEAQGGGDLPPKYKASVAGKAVRLDARFYPGRSPGDLFSAVVDAMTALNVPVDSVDSPSGIITSDWIRKGKLSSYVIFGFGDKGLVRYKYIVRTYRARTSDGKQGAQLEIRTIGQLFESGKGWVTKPIKQQPVNELFQAVSEELARMDKAKLPPAAKPQQESAPAPKIDRPAAKEE